MANPFKLFLDWSMNWPRLTALTLAGLLFVLLWIDQRNSLLLIIGGILLLPSLCLIGICLLMLIPKKI